MCFREFPLQFVRHKAVIEKIHAEARAPLRVEGHQPHHRSAHGGTILRHVESGQAAGVGFPESLPESHHACDLKRDVDAVNRMPFTIIHAHPYLSGSYTRQRTGQHIFFGTLTDGCQEPDVDDSSDEQFRETSFPPQSIGCPSRPRTCKSAGFEMPSYQDSIRMQTSPNRMPAAAQVEFGK